MRLLFGGAEQVFFSEGRRGRVLLRNCHGKISIRFFGAAQHFDLSQSESAANPETANARRPRASIGTDCTSVPSPPASSHGPRRHEATVDNRAHPKNGRTR